MNDQLLSGLVWNESEHDRTGGPAYCTEGCCAIPGEREATIYDNTPLQEQVEQQDKHIFQLEDALSKSVDVIAALCAERKDLTEQVYQAQMDAQDWQNKYNEAKRLQHPNTWREAEDREWDALLADRDMFRGQVQDWQNKYNSLAKAYNTFTATITSLRDEVDAEKEKHFDYENLRTRVYQLTHDNTQLELRNERQANMIEYAKKALTGVPLPRREED